MFGEGLQMFEQMIPVIFGGKGKTVKLDLLIVASKCLYFEACL